MSANARNDAKPATTLERVSDRELVVTRRFNAPARIVFAAWTTPALLQRWWTPKSLGITFISCEADVREGGAYRFVFGHASSERPMAFFGHYLEVITNARLKWTNEEGEDGGNVTTVTFEESAGETLVTIRDLYPSKAALDEAMETGGIGFSEEMFGQLDGVMGA